jgi:predicted O-methyltransferase YrrM
LTVNQQGIFINVKKTAIGSLLFPPEGMIKSTQGLRLTSIAYFTKGDILEIGSWVGKSTSYLASGLRFSGVARKLVSIDNHFKNRKEFEDFFNINLDKSSEERKNLYLRHLTRPGGTVESLKENLDDRALLDYVDIWCGDFLDFENDENFFEFVFCDVTHNSTEIKRNVPKIISMLKEDAILACDDFRYPDMLPALDEIHRFERIYLHKYMLFASRGRKANKTLDLSCFGCRKIR